MSIITSESASANTSAAPALAIHHALGRLREIVSELNELHIALIGENSAESLDFGLTRKLSFERTSALRAWLKLKSDRAAIVLILLLRTPGGLVTFEAILLALGIDPNQREAMSVKNRKLVHVYMCDLRHGLARAGFQDAIQSRPTLGYVLSATSARSVLKAFGNA
jgi:hypothetical protein